MRVGYIPKYVYLYLKLQIQLFCFLSRRGSGHCLSQFWPGLLHVSGMEHFLAIKPNEMGAKRGGIIVQFVSLLLYLLPPGSLLRLPHRVQC